ncbi:hypothetical protein D9611_005434 [Ephemerocybe angulata]|uniref:Uncharacterized protein n=1 Tax=Ephemerocybe angulata TaxID=980116 RepID=A0A8H5C002_9AGAR|nr:hypothetical protein D9611_005434 [Tulosesus angulatus]
MPVTIVDDTDPQSDSISLNGDCWEERFDQKNAYNGTISTCHAAASGSSNSTWMKFNFSGTALTMVGRPTANLKLNYTLDDGPKLKAPLNYTTSEVGKDGVTLLNLNKLSQGNHTLTLWPFGDDFNLDYFIFNNSDSRHDSDMLYADSEGLENGFIYEGVWDLTRRVPDTAQSLHSGGTWASTNVSIGYMAFNFTGAQIYLYGHRNFAKGRLQIQYSLKSLNAGTIFGTREIFDGRQQINASRWDFVQLFHTIVPYGNHRVYAKILNITEDQSFNFGFLTYTSVTPPGWNPGGNSPGKVTFGDQPLSKSVLGGIVGGACGVLLIGVLYILLRHRKRAREQIAREAIALQTRTEARAARSSPPAEPREDWEGPTFELAPPPWSPPTDPEDEPPPPPPEDWDEPNTGTTPLRSAAPSLMSPSQSGQTEDTAPPSSLAVPPSPRTSTASSMRPEHQPPAAEASTASEAGRASTSSPSRPPNPPEPPPYVS